MVVYNPILDAGVLPALRTQIAAGVSKPTVDVDCEEELVGQYTRHQVDDSNQKLVDIIKKLPQFIEKGYFSSLSSTHPFLVAYAEEHPEWAALGVMLVDHPDLKVKVDGIRNNKVGQRIWGTSVYKVVGLIYHFEQHYLGVDNGLQQMINDLCINSADGTTLDGREAFLQEITWSHLHSSDTIFDANPKNGIFETQAKNEHRWMCQRVLWSTCRCKISCLQGEIMSFSSWFEKIVEKEMATVYGFYPALTERDVRRSFLSRIRKWFNDHAGTYPDLPDYVNDPQSMVPKYQDLESMRPRINVKSPHDLQGYLPEGQTDRVKADEMILGEKRVPPELLQQLKEAVRPLCPVKTKIVEEVGGDDAATVAAVVAEPHPFDGVEPPTEASFDQDRVDRDNYRTLCCVAAIPCVLMNASRMNFVTASNHTRAANDPVPTDVEVHVQSIFYKGKQLDADVQQMTFDYTKTEWGLGSIVNDYLRAGHADESLYKYSKIGIYRPTLPKLLMICAIIINGWDNVWGGDLQKALRHLSIVGPIPSSDGRADGSGGEEEEDDEGGEGEGEGNAVPAAESVGVISGVSARAQHVDASHRDHPTTNPLLQTARCARTSRILYELHNLNIVRRPCSDMPWVVCLGWCEHIPACNKMHIKLTEELLKLCVSVALNTEVRPGGDFVDGDYTSITRHYLELFKRSFEADNAPECPEWIDEIDVTLTQLEEGEEEEEGNLYNVWQCNFCQDRFQRKELCIAHESTCESRPDGMFPEPPVEAPPPARCYPPSSALGFSDEDFINFIKSLIKFGTEHTASRGFFSQSIKSDMKTRDPTFDCTRMALIHVWNQGDGSGRFNDFLNGRQRDRNVTDEGTGLVTGTTRGPVTLAHLAACTGSNQECACICHHRYIDPAYPLPPAPAPEV